MKKQITVIFIAISLIGFLQIWAQTVEVTTSKKIYHYGDHLQVTISVSDITQNFAKLYIIDSSGKKSTPIPIQIRNLTTTITSPNSFDSAIFSQGSYQIQVLYGNASSTTKFDLVDTSSVVLPLGSDILVPQWANGSISDYIFLKFLADKNLIKDSKIKQDVKLPFWYKVNGVWWYEKKITDQELLSGIIYLLNKQKI